MNNIQQTEFLKKIEPELIKWKEELKSASQTMLEVDKILYSINERIDRLELDEILSFRNLLERFLTLEKEILVIARVKLSMKLNETSKTNYFHIGKFLLIIDQLVVNFERKIKYVSEYFEQIVVYMKSKIKGRIE